MTCPLPKKTTLSELTATHSKGGFFTAGIGVTVQGLTKSKLNIGLIS